MADSTVVHIYVDALEDEVIRAVGDVMEVRELAPEYGAVRRVQEVPQDGDLGYGEIEVSFCTDRDKSPLLIRPHGGQPVDTTRFPILLLVSSGTDEDDRGGAWAVFGSLASYGFRAVLSYDNRVVRAESYGA